MKICDRCAENTPAVFTLLVVEEDQSFDLCTQHKQEVIEFIMIKPKKKFGRKKHSAKAG